MSVSRLCEVEIEDLLRRPAVPIDLSPVRGYLAGRTVLVTGGGSSIGSELVRQLVQVGVARVVALGHGEDGIYELRQGLARRGVTTEVVPVTPTSAISIGCGTCSRVTGPRWCSTRPPTSTCR